MTYIVSFQYAPNIFCTNVVEVAYEAVEKMYSEYPWYYIKEAVDWQVEEAKRKGMPIIKV